MKEQMVSWESWVTDAEKSLLAVRRFSDETHLIGLSLGATIAILLSSLHKFRSAILLAPAIYPKYTVKERFWSVVRKATPRLFYKFAGWNGEVAQAMDYVRAHSQKIHKPILGLQARDDTRLSTKGLKFLRQIAVHQKSEVILLPHGSHVLTRGQAKEEVFQRIHKFIEQL
jgi:esterase/lipase